VRTRYLATLAFSIALVAGCGSSGQSGHSSLLPSTAQGTALHPLSVTPTPLPKTDGAGIPFIDWGGPVLEWPRIFLVYWNWPSDPAGEKPVLQNFLSGVQGSSWLNTVTQYYDSTDHIHNSDHEFKGTWSDPNPLPSDPSDLTALAAEATRASAHFGYDKNSVYILAEPSGYDSGNACNAHHNSTTVTPPYVPYIILRYASSACENEVNPGAGGVFDEVTLLAGHELAEAITDPFVQNNEAGWADDADSPDFGDYKEVADVCELFPDAPPYAANVNFSTGTFVVQPLWSNKANGCVYSGP